MSPHCDDENSAGWTSTSPPSHNIHASTQWRQTSPEGWMPAGSDKGREVRFRGSKGRFGSKAEIQTETLVRQEAGAIQPVQVRPR